MTKSQNGKLDNRRCCVGLRAFIFDVGPHSPSGQSLFSKARFAGTLSSPFAIMAVIGSAKDIYLEKFGADTVILGILTSILSFYGLLNDCIHGALQDRNYLAWLFPLEKWGRRAPWLLTHLLLGAGASCAIYLPPMSGGGQEDWLLHTWFFVCTFIGWFGVSSCIMAFEAARQELYPYKEERMVVEGCSKYACMAGGSAGGLPVMLIQANASAWIRLALQAFILPISLFSLQSLSILRKARALSSSEKYGSALTILREAFRPNGNSAFRHMLLVKWWNGVYGGTTGSLLYYYVTYSMMLTGWERLGLGMAAGLAAGVTETVMNVLMMRLFTTSQSTQDVAGVMDRRLLMMVTTSRVCNSAATILFMGLLEPTPVRFVVWCVTSRMFIGSFSFWRVAAQNWLVDEDTHLGEIRGRRRQGTIFGSLAMAQNAGGMLFGNAAFLGLGLAGLRTINCEYECELIGNSTSSCLADCTDSMVKNQPESVRLYIRVLLGLIGPCFELLLAFHTYKMPLKGLRLRRLYNQIALERGEEVCKGAELDVVPYAPPRASRISVSMFENAVLTYKGHLMAGVEYSPARLENTISLIDKGRRKKSATVIFYGQAGEDALKSIQQAQNGFRDGCSPRCTSSPNSRSPSSAQSLTNADCSTDGDADTLPSKPEATGQHEMTLPREADHGSVEHSGTGLALIVSRESASTLPWPPPQVVPRAVPCEDPGLPDQELQL